MKILKRLLSVIILFTSFAHSQQKLSGKVINGKNKPIANVEIYLDSIYSGGKTDRKGNFEIIFFQKVTTINIYSNVYGLLSNKFNNEKIMNFMFLNSEIPLENRTQKGEF